LIVQSASQKRLAEGVEVASDIPSSPPGSHIPRGPHELAGAHGKCRHSQQEEAKGSKIEKAITSEFAQDHEDAHN
jgi:hypothetical protein